MRVRDDTSTIGRCDPTDPAEIIQMAKDRGLGDAEIARIILRGPPIDAHVAARKYAPIMGYKVGALLRLGRGQPL